MRADLQKAYDAADLSGTLDEAMQRPLLKRCLEITARALAQPANISPPPAAGTSMRRPGHTSKDAATPRLDFKRASAADLD